MHTLKYNRTYKSCYVELWIFPNTSSFGVVQYYVDNCATLPFLSLQQDKINRAIGRSLKVKEQY